jgi:transposase
MTAIVAWASGACQWREVKTVAGCASSTAHDRLKEWKEKGVFKRMKDAGLDEKRELQNIDWTVLR